MGADFCQEKDEKLDNITKVSHNFNLIKNFDLLLHYVDLLSHTFDLFSQNFDLLFCNVYWLYIDFIM